MSAIAAQVGDPVTVHHTATLVDGTAHDSSAEGEPLVSALDQQTVIRGFEFSGMGDACAKCAQELSQ